MSPFKVHAQNLFMNYVEIADFSLENFTGQLNGGWVVYQINDDFKLTFANALLILFLDCLFTQSFLGCCAFTPKLWSKSTQAINA